MYGENKQSTQTEGRKEIYEIIESYLIQYYYKARRYSISLTFTKWPI